MSIYELWFYFVVLPAISRVSVAFELLGILTCIGSFFLWLFKEEIAVKSAGLSYKPIFTIAILLLALTFITSLAPNEKQVALLAGGYITTNTEGVAELPENMVKAANKFLEEISEEQE